MSRKDPTLHSENDSAPFTKTSETAAARRQSGPEPAARKGEALNPPKVPGEQGHDEVSVGDVSRAGMLAPTRPRKPEERNPELDKE